jgi:hypothetical protein
LISSPRRAAELPLLGQHHDADAAARRPRLIRSRQNSQRLNRQVAGYSIIFD